MRYLALMFIYLVLASSAYSSSCEECHVTLPADRSHEVHSGFDKMIPAYGDPGYTEQYSTNAKSYGFNCGNCHPSDSGKHDNGRVDIELFNKNASGLKALNRGDADYDSAQRRCSGVYCHSTGEQGKRVTYIKSPRWNREEKGSRCHECHDSPPVYKSMPERPNGHFNSNRGSGHLLGIHWDSVKGHSNESFKFNTATQMGCSTCHYETVRTDGDMGFVDRVSGLFTCVRCHELSNGEIYNYSTHVNGKLEIAFSPVKMRSKAQMMRPPRGWKRKGTKGKAMSYDEAEVPLSAILYNEDDKSCSNVSCHIYVEKVFWHDTVNCGQCHERFMGKQKKRDRS
ncbi:MAG: CxxxxCH/CxxCH domain-containing protein [Thermodesulfovibrionales bacterium]